MPDHSYVSQDASRDVFPNPSLFLSVPLQRLPESEWTLESVLAAEQQLRIKYRAASTNSPVAVTNAQNVSQLLF